MNHQLLKPIITTSDASMRNVVSASDANVFACPVQTAFNKGRDWFTLAAMKSSWRMAERGLTTQRNTSGSNVNAHGRPSTRSVLKTLLPRAYEHPQRHQSEGLVYQIHPQRPHGDTTVEKSATDARAPVTRSEPKRCRTHRQAKGPHEPRPLPANSAMVQVPCKGPPLSAYRHQQGRIEQTARHECPQCASTHTC